MKKLITITISLMACISLWSQETSSPKRLENNIMIGAGLFGETGNRASDVFPGAVLRFSYGLDVRVCDHWSVMPGTISLQKGRRWSSVLGPNSPT